MFICIGKKVYVCNETFAASLYRIFPKSRSYSTYDIRGANSKA